MALPSRLPDNDVEIYFAVVVTTTIPPELPAILTNTFQVADHLSGMYDFIHAIPVNLMDLSTSEKSVSPNLIQSGELLTFTVSLTNTGGTEPGMRIIDPIPAHTTFHAVDVSVGSAVYSGTLNAVVWDTPVAASGNSVMTLTVQVDSVYSGDGITNTITFNDSKGEEYTLVAGVTNYLAPNFSTSTKTANQAELQLGEIVTYTVMITNTGGNDPSVDFSDIITDGLIYDAGSLSYSSGSGGYNGGLNSIYWNGEIGQNDVITIQYAAEVGCINADFHKNSATVTDSYANPSDISITIPALMPDFDVSLTANIETWTLSSTFTYTLVIDNSAGGVAPNVVADTTLPTGATYGGSYTALHGTVSSFGGAIKTVRWAGSVDAGEIVTVTFSVNTPSTYDIPLLAATAAVDDGCATTLNSVLILGPENIFFPIIVR
jgi:uncharacterized repeat protein (TIGR01451 family)